jgi:hypothetical protein
MRQDGWGMIMVGKVLGWVAKALVMPLNGLHRAIDQTQ